MLIVRAVGLDMVDIILKEVDDTPIYPHQTRFECGCSIMYWCPYAGTYLRRTVHALSCARFKTSGPFVESDPTYRRKVDRAPDHEERMVMIRAGIISLRVYTGGR